MNMLCCCPLNLTIFLLTTGNQVIREVDLAAGTVAPYAGTTQYSSRMDGPYMMGSAFFNPAGLAVDSLGQLYVCDQVSIVFEETKRS